MAYNLSLLDNATSIVTVVQAANTYTENVLGAFLLGIIGIALFFTFRRANTLKTTIAASLFIVTMLSVLLTLMSLTSAWMVGVCVLLLSLAVISMINDS